MIRNAGILAFISFAIFNLTAAAIIDVPGDYSSIQAGITASSDGDTVLVQPGTYYENINFDRHNIVLGSLYLTTGDAGYVHRTVIDGKSGATVVTFESGEESSAVITGFTIQNGFALFGAGIKVLESSPVIKKNIIQNNIGFGQGGGIYCKNSLGVRLEDNIIQNNRVNYSEFLNPCGGGLCAQYSEVLIANNIFSSNFSHSSGAAIYCSYSEIELIDNLVKDNESLRSAVLYADNSYARLEKNVIFHNGNEINELINFYGSNYLMLENLIYENRGGVVASSRFDSASIINNTIANNDGQAIRSYDGNLIIRNTIFWGNMGDVDTVYAFAPDIAYCLFRGDWDGEGNLDANPLFVNAADGKFNVCSQSPCIDAGDPRIAGSDGTRSDIGVTFDEHPNCYVAKTWYIDGEESDTTGNGSIDRPFRTIQRGINVAVSGDTVVVGNGAYYENVDISCKNIFLASYYYFTGDTLDILNTIIDGYGAGSGISVNGCDSLSAIIGFTMRNGYAERGGGIDCRNSRISIANNIIENNNAELGGGLSIIGGIVNIEDNIIRQNVADDLGGGIICGSGEVDITNNMIVDNKSGHSSRYNSGHGGGIFCVDETVSINSNTISGNKAGENSIGNGGGIFLYEAVGVITNNMIDDNHCGWQVSCGGGIGSAFTNLIIAHNIFNYNTSYFGGGIHSSRDTLDIKNNIFTKNRGVMGGAGIDCYDTYSNNSSRRFVNNVFCGNVSINGTGGAINIEGEESSILITNNILWHDTSLYGIDELASAFEEIIVTYNNIEDSAWTGEGNISLEPFFRDIANGDFHLMATECGDTYDSPCIDLGDPGLLDSLLDCDWGLGELRSDMGAYGGGLTARYGAYIPDIDLPARVNLIKNYPNPFNSQTTISFALDSRQHIKLDVYNIMGQMAAPLVDEILQVGSYDIVWDAGRHASGIYLARLIRDNKPETIRMILLK